MSASSPALKRLAKLRRRYRGIGAEQLQMENDYTSY